MDHLIQVFGAGKDLNSLQMTSRGIVVFILAWGMIRISGRRSFGLRAPFDNIILVLLGGVLSRAVTGASPFVPTIIACTTIVVLHRILGHLISRHESISNLVEGKKILLFKDNKFLKDNMDRALVCEEDIMQGVRKSALTDKIEKIDSVYMERNGEISPIKKETAQ
jgi:uncharacterized membrane protein YcaP (DUF421 family)